jgi:hypothetical protein
VNYTRFISKNVMSQGIVRQLRRMCKDGLKNAHDEKRSCPPYVVVDDLVQSIDQKFMKDIFRTFV